MTQEIWKAIPGYEGRYEVSSQGRVRSLAREVLQKVGGRSSRVSHRNERMMKPTLNYQGRIVIRLCRDGVKTTFRVHRLVALAFLGPCRDGMEVAHNDGNPQNNHIENLRYDTRAGNLADCVRHGTDGRGERNNHAKLTEAEVFAIRSAPGSQRKLARQFGVCQKHICRIKRGERWGHLGHSEIHQ